jgi:hypothetical protein
LVVQFLVVVAVAARVRRVMRIHGIFAALVCGWLMVAASIGLLIAFGFIPTEIPSGVSAIGAAAMVAGDVFGGLALSALVLGLAASGVGVWVRPLLRAARFPSGNIVSAPS